MPAALPSETVVGVTENWQAPAWVTWNVLPATLAVPTRADDPGFWAIANPTFPDPWPPAGDATAIQDALDVADHSQPSVTLTPTLMLSADDGIDMPLLESVALHSCAVVVAACVTVNVRPATLIVPVRSADDVFAATEY